MAGLADDARPSVSARPAPTRLQDFWFRVLLSPVLGVIVPAFSGLVDPSRHTTASRLASFAYFSVLAFVVWEGNRRLYYKLSRREDWLERPWYRAGLLMTVIVMYTTPVSGVLLLAWQRVTGDPGVSPYGLPTAVVGIVAIAAVLALSTTPLVAQDATETPAPSAETTASPAPETAPEPVASEPVAAETTTVQPAEAETPAPATTTRRASTRTESTTSTARRTTSKPAGTAAPASATPVSEAKAPSASSQVPETASIRTRASSASTVGISSPCRPR